MSWHWGDLTITSGGAPLVTSDPASHVFDAEGLNTSSTRRVTRARSEVNVTRITDGSAPAAVVNNRHRRGRSSCPRRYRATAASSLRSSNSW